MPVSGDSMPFCLLRDAGTFPWVPTGPEEPTQIKPGFPQGIMLNSRGQINWRLLAYQSRALAVLHATSACVSTNAAECGARASCNRHCVGFPLLAASGTPSALRVPFVIR